MHGQSERPPLHALAEACRAETACTGTVRRLPSRPTPTGRSTTGWTWCSARS